MRNRREVIKVLGGLWLTGLALAHEGHTPGAGQEGPSMGRGLVPARPIPWEKGRCAFCGMPIRTPSGRTPGFYEQSYSQIAFHEPRPAPHDPQEAVEALHFESIACMVNYAFVHGLADGDGMTFYVTDRGAYDPARPQETVRLIPARWAVFYWGENLPVVMKSRLLAFAGVKEARAFAEAHPEHGRRAFYPFRTLWDLAPLPEAGLVQLLARHAGLLQDSGGQHQH